ncbi:MAG: DNA repair protein RadC [Vicinamibacterales bacterium]
MACRSLVATAVNASSPQATGMAGLAPSERPRERLHRLGAAALGDRELVAVVLGTGVRQREALSVAAALLAEAGGLAGLARAVPAQLARVPGVGPSRALRLVAALELGRRAVSAPRVERPRLATPSAAAAYLLPEHGGHREERFGAVLLDTKHRVLRVVPLTTGTLDASLVHPREVFRAAAEHSAAAVLVFHNHPSGDPTPSSDDLQLTRRLVAAGELMGIVVVDHVVLGHGCWQSLRDGWPAIFRP